MIRNVPRVYLDHNAAAPLRQTAREALVAALAAGSGNPSSVHAEGRSTRALIDTARRRVAALIGARPHEILFTSSGTEACHLALAGFAGAAALPGRIVTTAVEHAAVREPLAAIEASGWVVDTVPVDASGRVDPERYAAALRPDTMLAVCMAANNETGVIQPVGEIAALCRARGVRLFSDAVQAAGRLPVDVTAVPVDLLALSSHKIGGPTGAGALFVREGTPLAAVVSGGGQESGLRGGTENAPAIAAFGVAAEEVRREMDRNGDALSGAMPVRALRDRLEAAVLAAVPGATVVAASSDRLAGTAQFLVPCDDEEMLILALDRSGYAVSAGSACAAGAHRRSHVLEAMGVLKPGFSSVRVSLGAANTAADVDGFAAALARIACPEGCVR